MGSRPAARALRTHWRPAFVLGALNAAIPFWLVAWGEKHIDSSIAGIAQATVAIFTFLLAARFLPHEAVGVTRILGVAIGFVGVAVLAGFDPAGGWIAVAGTLAVVLSSLSYAGAGVYGQLRVQTVPGPVLATGSMLAGGLILLPLALFQLPTHVPDAEAIGSLLALTVVGTTFAQLILFRMLRLYGARRLSLVTYLIPGFALFYGAVLLDEPITVAALAGPRADPRRRRPGLRRAASALASRRPGGTGVSVAIRRAGADDLDFIVELVTHEDVEPFLAVVRARERSEILGEIERSEHEPEAFGVFVIEVDGARAGTMRFELSNRRSRIANLGALAVHPDFRGRKVADQAARLFQRYLFDELGFHRLEMEIYGFNERAMAHAERAGWIQEGVRRKAYWRNDHWVDGVRYGLVVDDLEDEPPSPPPSTPPEQRRARRESSGHPASPAARARRDRRDRRA